MMQTITIISLFSASLLLACTYNTGNREFKMNTPFGQGQEWELRMHDAQSNDRKKCVIDAGYNGIKIVLAAKGEKISASIKSNRRIKSGAFLSLRIGSQVYRSWETFFKAQQVDRIIHDLNTNDTAYLRWAEVNSRSKNRTAFTNNLKLDQFQKHYQTCLDSIGTT